MQPQSQNSHIPGQAIKGREGVSASGAITDANFVRELWTETHFLSSSRTAAVAAAAAIPSVHGSSVSSDSDKCGHSVVCYSGIYGTS